MLDAGRLRSFTLQQNYDPDYETVGTPRNKMQRFASLINQYPVHNRKHIRGGKWDVLPSRGKYELILNSPLATLLQKSWAGARKGWKSNWKQTVGFFRAAVSRVIGFAGNGSVTWLRMKRAPRRGRVSQKYRWARWGWEIWHLSDKNGTTFIPRRARSWCPQQSVVRRSGDAKQRWTRSRPNFFRDIFLPSRSRRADIFHEARNVSRSTFDTFSMFYCE